MKVIKVKNYEELSRTAATIIAGTILSKPDCILGLATGSSPVGTYDQLAAMYEEGILDFSHVKSVNLDEYVGLDGSNDQSYRYFMNKNLFEKVDIRMEATHVPSGAVKSDEEAEQYDAEIKAAGGIDLQLLGIGNNGHIGFNEPLTPFTSMTHIVKLTDSTREANKRFFASIDDVPTHAVTMGIHTVMQAKSIILMAFGEGKAEIIKKTVDGRPEIAVPASLLQLHDDVELYLDEAAASKLS